MKIESIELEDIGSAGILIKKVFDEFAASGYSKNGAAHFYKVIREEAIRERLLNGNLIFVAKNCNKIIAYIEIMGLNHIYLLFVDKEFQRKGIGRKLIDFSLNILLKNSSNFREVTVNSTAFAVNVYEKLGFEKIADFQMKDGIISFPMKRAVRQI